jgi:dethiobiotin synthetase
VNPGGFFVTGTDTGVGKTTVTAGLLSALRRRGVSVAPLKPAETGCTRGSDGGLIPEDGLLLRAACGLPDLPLDTIVPIRYVTPVAPHVATVSEKAPPFSLDRVLACLDQLRSSLVFVEGAGGLAVPYADSILGVHVAKAIGFPLLIVARASLGTINHTLLTIFEARRHGLEIAGVILNRVIPERGPDEDTNGSEIERVGQVKVLATIPHRPVAVAFDPLAAKITSS